MDIQALMESATRAHRAGRLEQAQALYTKVIAKDPNAWNNLTAVYLDQGQTVEAVK